MTEKQLSQLLDKYISQQCTEEEKLQVEEWYASLNIGDVAGFSKTAFENEEQYLGHQYAVFEVLLQQKIDKETSAPAKVVSFKKKVFGWVAAAAVLIVSGWSIYYFAINKTDQPGSIAEEKLPYNIQAPDKSRATITLANGDIVYLDEANDGRLAQVGNVNLVKLNNGQISYEYAEEASAPLSLRKGGEVYNTLHNPRGSQVIDITLSDGSRVWLNAGSSITYPVAFLGEERKVEIQGEGYFEVAPSNSPEGGKKRPFRVMLPASADGENRGEVLVLGTHFNINAYEDEEEIKVTLLEGAVRLSLTKPLNLKPGQQGISKNLSPFTLNPSPSIEQVMAWKNGLFAFSGADIKEVMRQLARWYNLEVHYAGAVPSGRFKGKIAKDLSLAQVLEILSDTRIKYKIEEKNRITILPQ